MRQRIKGVALISILIVAATLLAILSVGLKLGSSGVLYVSQTHQRNVSMAAAEAGVYEAMRAIEADVDFTGTLTGTLTESNASYIVEVENDLLGTRQATVVSTGQFGRVKRTLRVELEPDSGGFGAMGLDGKIYVFDKAYVNAISSTDKPIPRPGHSHSEFSGSEAYTAKDFDDDGTDVTIHASGRLTANGSFHSDLTRIAASEATGVTQEQYRLDPAEMTSGTFVDAGTISPGTLATSTRVTGDLELTGALIVPAGVTLHVEGDARFLGGIKGEGQVVIDGDVFIRTNSEFDSSIEEGIKLHAGESIFITHPETEIEGGLITESEFNEVGDFFAQMPMNTPSELSVDIPTAAPQGADFFSWYNDNVDAPDSEFTLWYDGDGTDIHPGLSEDTKQWLDQSRAIYTQIEEWAAGT